MAWDSLDLHPAAAGDAHVHVLAGGAQAAAGAAAGVRHAGDEAHACLDVPGVQEVGFGDRLGQRHAQSVGAEDDAVAHVGDLASRVFFQGELADAQDLVAAQDAVAEGDGAAQAHHGRALEARGDGAVQVLLAHDVELAHELEVIEARHLQGVAHGLLVHGEGRGVVHLVGADAAACQPVDDLLAGLELHQGGAVVLAQLTQRGAHMTQDLGVHARGADASGAAAEELALRLELLVDLQPAQEAQGVVVGGRHLVERALAEVQGGIGAGVEISGRPSGARPGRDDGVVAHGDLAVRRRGVCEGASVWGGRAGLASGPCGR